MVSEFEDFTWREAPPDKEGAKRNSVIKKAHSGVRHKYMASGIFKRS